MNFLFPEFGMASAAAKGYAAFSINSMRLQAEFERTGKYKEKTYIQAAAEVYFNDDYMAQEYLPGLLLSHYLWPHHYRQIQFFKNAFVQAMEIANSNSFMEVGVGTGLYSRLMLRALPNVYGVGLDISPSSKSFAEWQLGAFGVEGRYKMLLQDITVHQPSKKVEWMVCVEVLEHLDDPVAFLRSLRSCMTSESKAFITAAVNAAHTDHIYLYKNADEVLVHLLEAGFTLEQSFVGAAYKPTTFGLPVPQAVAFIVS